MSDAERTLKQMLEDLNHYNRNKEDLLPYYIQERLNLSLKNYYHDLVNSYKTILAKGNDPKVLEKVSEKDD